MCQTLRYVDGTWVGGGGSLKGVFLFSGEGVEIRTEDFWGLQQYLYFDFNVSQTMPKTTNGFLKYSVECS